MVGDAVHVVASRRRVKRQLTTGGNVQVLPVLLLQLVLAVANVGNVVRLGAALEDGEAIVLRDVMVVGRVGEVKVGALFFQSVQDPALADVFVAGRGCGGTKRLVVAVGRQGVAVGLEDEVAALGQITADALVAVFKEERLLLCLVAVGVRKVVFAAGAGRAEFRAA